jgi:hypothetical protein
MRTQDLFGQREINRAELAQLILQSIGREPGLLARQMANKITKHFGKNVTRGEINSILYKELRGRVKQSRTFGWFPISFPLPPGEERIHEKPYFRAAKLTPQPPKPQPAPATVRIEPQPARIANVVQPAPRQRILFGHVLIVGMLIVLAMAILKRDGPKPTPQGYQEQAPVQAVPAAVTDIHVDTIVVEEIVQVIDQALANKMEALCREMVRLEQDTAILAWQIAAASIDVESGEDITGSAQIELEDLLRQQGNLLNEISEKRDSLDLLTLEVEK